MSSRARWRDLPQLLVLDPRDASVQRTVRAHTAALSDLAISNNLIVTGGYTTTQHGSQMLPDPFIKIFDIRSLRASVPLQV
jgi:hypothetical protein